MWSFYNNRENTGGYWEGMLVKKGFQNINNKTLIWRVFPLYFFLFLHKSILVRGSCHIQNAEIGIEYWNCHQILNLCFFKFSAEKKNQILKKYKLITLIELWTFFSFDLKHINSLKAPQNATFGRSFFSPEN